MGDWECPCGAAGFDQADAVSHVRSQHPTLYRALITGLSTRRVRRRVRRERRNDG